MRIGIIGGGQLGLMLIAEGRKLGYQFSAIDRSLNYPGVRVADMGYTYDDYRKFVDSSDVVTYEFEHVDDRVLEYADSMGKLRPGMLPIELKRDRSREKEFLRKNDFPVSPFFIAKSLDDLKDSSREFRKAVAKSAEGGYDGKGQYIIENGVIPGDLRNGKYVVEQFIDFDMEASVIASRDLNGRKAFHTASLNFNASGMLLYNLAPCQDYGMREIVSRLLDRLNYVGTMGVEFFIKDGKPIINEFSPRVHNSGHHTLVGSTISQFEQHVRAITGLPVPDPVLLAPSGILNIIGRDIDDDLRKRILEVPGTQLYWYGKSGIRKRRKVGHINIVGKTTTEMQDKIKAMIETVYGGRVEEYLAFS